MAIQKKSARSYADQALCGDSRTTFNPKSATPFKSNFS